MLLVGTLHLRLQRFKRLVWVRLLIDSLVMAMPLVPVICRCDFRGSETGLGLALATRAAGP